MYFEGFVANTSLSMSDSLVINRAARVLARVSPELPADQALREEVRTSYDLSSAEKRDIARAVFVYFRWRSWLDSKATLQIQLASALDFQRRFDADPSSIKPEALAALAVPTWLRDEMELPAGYLRQLQRDPCLWIRPQIKFATSVARALGDCTPADLSASSFDIPASSFTAFRYTGSRDLYKNDEFQKGLFEIQDLGSQLVGHACAPQPGETWWDACAGEGGKTAHLADLMQNKGLIWASDRSTRRLAHLRKRLARAQVFNYRAVDWQGGPVLPTKTKFDGILLDAPCSGVGTWQRNPHARWTTTPEDVRELAEIQLQLLHHIAPALKPGGRLIYAVCTLTRSETTAVVEKFSTAHPDFETTPLSALNSPLSTLFLWPQDYNANGMFLAAWKKKS